MSGIVWMTMKSQKVKLSEICHSLTNYVMSAINTPKHLWLLCVVAIFVPWKLSGLLSL